MAEQFKGFQITCAFYLFDFAGWELGIDEVHQRHVALEGFQHPAAGLLVEGIFGQFVECRFVSAFIDDDRAVVNAAHHSGDASPFVQQLLGAAVTNSAYTFDVVGGIPCRALASRKARGVGRPISSGNCSKFTCLCLASSRRLTQLTFLEPAAASPRRR